MIRTLTAIFALCSVPLLYAAPAAAAPRRHSAAASGKPDPVGTFGDWTAYVAKGKDKTCYALAQPDKRAPANLQRDPAYVFISTRPTDGVRNELSIVEGFDVKNGGDQDASAAIGSASFKLIAKGSDLWLEDDSQGPQMIAAMKKGAQMTVTAMSMRGNVTTDTYSLSGLTKALDAALKGCK